MAYEQKPNQGSLFRNEKKKDDKHPDYTGKALIGGVAYKLGAWVNEVQSGPQQGKKYFKINFTPEQQQSSGRSTSRQTQYEEDNGDDIPF